MLYFLKRKFNIQLIVSFFFELESYAKAETHRTRLRHFSPPIYNIRRLVEQPIPSIGQPSQDNANNRVDMIENGNNHDENEENVEISFEENVTAAIQENNVSDIIEQPAQSLPEVEIKEEDIPTIDEDDAAALEHLFDTANNRGDTIDNGNNHDEDEENDEISFQGSVPAATPENNVIDFVVFAKDDPMPKPTVKHPHFFVKRDDALSGTMTYIEHVR